MHLKSTLLKRCLQWLTFYAILVLTFWGPNARFLFYRKQVTILSGTTAPNSEQGSNGSVYLQYGIPIEYTPVEYLEVTSMGPYIDTGVPCKNNPYYEVTFQYMQTPQDNYGVFGAFENSTEVIINTYGGVSYASAMAGQGANRAVFTSTALQKHTVLANAGGIYIDGVRSSATVNWSQANFSRTYYLFAFDFAGGPGIYKTANTRIYSCRLWSGSILLRHYVPVYRNSDNEPGMYDLVNMEFKSNAGTGSFSVGTPIEYGSTIQIAYAKVNGVWQDLIGTDISDIDLGA